jgi:flavin reductase
VPSDPTSRAYRDSVGMFTTGIPVVTAASERFGHGMTANAFASVSLDPLLVLVCVVKDAMMHKVLDEVGRFAVSVLAGGQEDLARYFSDSGRPAGMAQFVPVAWRPGPVSGAPLLDGALAYLECDVHAAHDGGDHTVFLGRARWVERAKPGGEPLLYFGGNYRRLENPPGTP